MSRFLSRHYRISTTRPGQNESPPPYGIGIMNGLRPNKGRVTAENCASVFELGGYSRHGGVVTFQDPGSSALVHSNVVGFSIFLANQAQNHQNSLCLVFQSVSYARNSKLFDEVKSVE